jgi:hypothetical protein
MKRKWHLDFALVGAPRSGTTWLWNCLRQHPDVYVPRVKELRFFNRPTFEQVEFRYERGIQFYESFFKDAPLHAVCGDITPTYYIDESLPARILSHYPEVKIIFQLRNPITLVHSAHYKLREGMPIEEDFEAAFENNDELRSLGKYGTHIDRFLEFIPRERIYIQVYEDVFADPRRACRDLFEFLEVDSAFEPRDLDNRVNPTRHVRSQSFVRLNHKFRRVMARPELSGVKRLLTRSPLLPLLHIKLAELNLKPVRERNELGSATRQRVVAYYEEDIRRVEVLLDRDLESWRI